MKKKNNRNHEIKNKVDVEKNQNNEIRVLSADDEKIKVVGEVLANEIKQSYIEVTIKH